MTTLEQSIRESAANYLVTAFTSQDLYASAAIDGAITADDIFYLGAVNAVGTVILDRLITLRQTPLHQDPAHGIHVVVQDDPEFRDTISDLGYQVLAKMYHCTRQEAEDRFYRIQELVTNYHNQRLKMKKE